MTLLGSCMKCIYASFDLERPRQNPTAYCRNFSIENRKLDEQCVDSRILQQGQEAAVRLMYLTLQVAELCW